MHVTICHFFGSGTNKKLVVAVTRSFVGAKTNIYNTGFKSVVKRKKNLPKTCSDPMHNRPRSSNKKSSGKVKIDEYVCTGLGGSPRRLEGEPLPGVDDRLVEVGPQGLQPLPLLLHVAGDGP